MGGDDSSWSEVEHWEGWVLWDGEGSVVGMVIWCCGEGEGWGMDDCEVEITFWVGEVAGAGMRISSDGDCVEVGTYIWMREETSGLRFRWGDRGGEGKEVPWFSLVGLIVRSFSS